MLKVNHNELKEMLKQYYKTKIALFIFGGFGIGKSFLVRDTSGEIAETRAREFVEWNKLPKDKKQEVYEYPEKYFTLIDIRMSEQDSTDIKGLPDFRDGRETIDWKIPLWEKYILQENSDGILFLDEFNLGSPLVLSSFYKVLYDRIVNDEKMSNNWLVVGAGNRDDDRGFTHTLPEPLRDRGGEVELINPSAEDWTIWAIKNNIDSRIIGFVNFKPSSLHKVDFGDNQKNTTERGLERLSNLTYKAKVNKEFELLCCSAIGEGIAREYIAFCKIQEKLKLEEIIKNPKKIEQIEDIAVKFFLVSAVAEKYSDKKNTQVDFDKVMEMSIVLDNIKNAEFVALLWRLSSSYTENFKKDFLKSKGHDKFIEKYGKFLI